MTEARDGLTRREFLAGTLGVAAGAALAACSSSSSTVSSTTSASGATTAQVDGDLYFFNWAQFIDPSIVKGFQEKYGVSVPR